MLNAMTKGGKNGSKVTWLWPVLIVKIISFSCFFFVFAFVFSSFPHRQADNNLQMVVFNPHYEFILQQS